MPDYRMVVAAPSDYESVGRRLAGGEYTTGPLAFAAEMRRIYSNALMYEPPLSPHPSLTRRRRADLARRPPVTTGRTRVAVCASGDRA